MDEGIQAMDLSSCLYNKINRVPKITREQVMEMIHIRPVLHGAGCFFYECGWDNGDPDPFNVAFLWDVKPVGDEFTFCDLNSALIIATTESSYYYKPTLAEIYAWIRVQAPDTWMLFSHFCVGEPTQFAGTVDYYMPVRLFGGPKLIKGEKLGEDAYALIEDPSYNRQQLESA